MRPPSVLQAFDCGGCERIGRYRASALLLAARGVGLSDLDFDQYSEQSVHFYSRHVPRLLRMSLAGLSRAGAAIVDIGCGDGHLVWSLRSNQLIPPGCDVLGIDLSPIRLRRFQALTGCATALASGQGADSVANGSIDLVLSTMVIEHVPDDAGHAVELGRITRAGGVLYLSTVIRKRGAWYFRKAPDGRRVLDPTHLREYATPEEVLHMVEAAGFDVESVELSRLFFPVAHPLIRWWHSHWPIRDVQRFFLGPMRWLELLALPIPRYRAIEVLARRRDTNPRLTS